ncbi:MAG: 4-(cytidine 5'-diphospho)-2-C-methyl-D-erythritol kinase [Deltaproteobacteria bacterium]|nr:4-(cytidine 5'-diphospho)-2-C-methyl-D-erythritol kinase [Deltaproteobacteria bacterium]
MSSIAVASPAKINLFLRVLRKRLDGYHDISSLMQPVGLYDNITIDVEDGDGIAVSCSKPELPADPSNLAHRAADLFLTRLNLKKHVRIFIEKNIPIGAGLGGGSSNAAAVIMGLNEALKTGLKDGEMMGMGAALGSDVPFFILKGPAFAEGRGEKLEKTVLPKLPYVLVNPGFQVSTAWVYNNLDLTKKTEDNNLSYSKKAFITAKDLRDCLVNDLEDVTLKKHPVISNLKNALIKAGAIGSLMSGSGPTVFGIFNDMSGAEAACKSLKDSLPEGNSVFLAPGL